MSSTPIVLRQSYSDMTPKESRCSRKSCCIAGGVVLGIVAAVGALTAAYFLNPTFHTMLGHAFSHIQYGQMSIGQGLLCIGLPIAGAGLVTGLAIHLYRRYRFANRSTLTPLPLREFLKPTQRELIITVIALAGLAALAVGGFFLFRHVSIAHQMMHHHFIPALRHTIPVWQALAYVGGGTVALSALTGLTLYLKRKHQEKQILQQNNKT